MLSISHALPSVSPLCEHHPFVFVPFSPLWYLLIKGKNIILSKYICCHWVPSTDFNLWIYFNSLPNSLLTPLQLLFLAWWLTCSSYDRTGCKLLLVPHFHSLHLKFNLNWQFDVSWLYVLMWCCSSCMVVDIVMSYCPVGAIHM